MLKFPHRAQQRLKKSNVYNLIIAKLISRKIRVAGKLLNFYTVWLDYEHCTSSARKKEYQRRFSIWRSKSETTTYTLYVRKNRGGACFEAPEPPSTNTKQLSLLTRHGSSRRAGNSPQRGFSQCTLSDRDTTTFWRKKSLNAHSSVLLFAKKNVQPPLSEVKHLKCVTKEISKNSEKKRKKSEFVRKKGFWKR